MLDLSLSGKSAGVCALEPCCRLHLGCCYACKWALLRSLSRTQAGDSIVEDTILVLSNEGQLFRRTVLRKRHIVGLIGLLSNNVASPP